MQSETDRRTGPGPTRRLTASMSRISDADFGYDEARHLLWRAGFGGTPQQIETLAAWGPERTVDFLLETDRIPYETPRADAFDRDIMRPLSEEERRAYQRARRQRDEDALARFRMMRQQSQRRDREQVRKLQRWWLARLIGSPRPLEEKMTLFWHGHFATSYRTIENSYHMYVQNQLFRSNALGNFGDLLFAIIRDPAMLVYLDNDESRRDRPNENLAREIMELFSLGVGNYGERDIREGARALTGYTYRDDEFYFDERNHDSGGKRILGVSGNHDGEDFVRIILSQSACAHFIAQKLYDFFVLHTNDPALVAGDETGRGAASAVRQLAGELRSNGYAIRPTLRRLFLSEHFYDPLVMNRRVKSPAELVVGAVRTMRTPVRDLDVLLQAMDLMGQSLMFPPSVKGWDGGRAWINTSTLFVRQNATNFLLTGKLPMGYDGSASEERYDPTPMLEPLRDSDPSSVHEAGRVVDYLLRFNLGRSPAHARRTLTEFASPHEGEVTPDLVTGMLLLISAMPEYQLC